MAFSTCCRHMGRGRFRSARAGCGCPTGMDHRIDGAGAPRLETAGEACRDADPTRRQVTAVRTVETTAGS